MKKTYISPAIEEILLQTTAGILAGSTLSLDSDDSATITGSGDDAEYGNALSREVDEWPNFVD